MPCPTAMSLAKKDANEATSPTVSPTAPNTAALAASSSGRRGAAISVGRIIPEV